MNLPRHFVPKRNSQSLISRFVIVAALLCLQAGVSFAEGGAASEPFVSEVVVPHRMDVDLRDLAVVPPWKPGDPIEVVPEKVAEVAHAKAMIQDPSWTDPVRQQERGVGSSATITASFAGIGFGGGFPPDIVGSVGANHYIQAVNASRFQIWDKDGNSLVGPLAVNTLWSGGASACTDGDGDPIVQYDEFADRWLISEFDLSGNTFCIYVSQTADPVSGGWFGYAFSAPSFPDYPQYGVWPDAYYVSTFESPNLGIYAFDRTQMLAGAPATMQRLTIPHLSGTSSRVTRILPADADGTAPGLGVPGIFVRTVDSTQDGSNPTDRLEIWELDVDFVTPGNTALSKVQDLIPADFTLLPCTGSPARNCVAQPGTTVMLDALFNRPLRRLQYRNFGTYETMVVTQVVDAGSGVAGKRWWELRRSGGDWSVHQEGTYSPDSVGRFMGSVAMNESGQIALGYSVSDASSVVPGIRVTGRLDTDPAGVMSIDEATLHAGVSVQTLTQRWGDYSSMNVDPVDGKTFWYTTQTVAANGFWETHVGAFRFGPEIFVDGFESGDTDGWSNSQP